MFVRQKEGFGNLFTRSYTLSVTGREEGRGKDWRWGGGETTSTVV